MTSNVPIKKTLKGDLIFFRGTRWKCPDGVSGFVLEVGEGFIEFAIGVAEPKAQILLFPTKNYKGSAWYQLSPEIRTLEPETDPPRPGDKDYKPNK